MADTLNWSILCALPGEFTVVDSPETEVHHRWVSGYLESSRHQPAELAAVYNCHKTPEDPTDSKDFLRMGRRQKGPGPSHRKTGTHLLSVSRQRKKQVKDFPFRSAIFFRWSG